MMEWYSYNINEIADEEYRRFYQLLNNEKKNRVDSLRKIDDKKRAVAGEMLARKAISEWCGMNCNDIYFETTSYGKPYARDLDVEFNIAHSGDIVVCAVDGRPVGIDIEKIRNIDMAICKYICTEKEIKYIVGESYGTYASDFLSDDNRLTRFFEVWTIKEAYLKKIGIGISSLSSLRNVAVDNIKESVIINVIENYIATVCIT